MRFSPRALGASLFSLLLVGTMLACSDQDGGMVLPPPTEPIDPPPSLAEVRCQVSVAMRTMRCGDPSESESARLGRLVLGGQGTLVNLTSAGIVVADTGTDSTLFSFDVTVENLIRMPFATQDTGSFSPHADGVRVFFITGPSVSGGSGDIDVANPDGLGTFTATGQPFFEYDDVNRSGPSPLPLLRNEVTMPKTWQLVMDNTVTDFEFTVAVASEVPFWNNVAPFYKGFTDVVPDSSAWRAVREDTVTVETGENYPLQGAVRTRLGRLETGSWPITYQSSNNAVATVDLAGVVTGVAEGSALVSGFASEHPSYRRTRVLVNDAPMVLPDSSWALENVRLQVAAPGVLENDSSRTVGEDVEVIAESKATTLGGTVTLNVDGSYDYRGPAGVNGTDSFYYLATDGFHTDSAQVTIRITESHVWFVHADSSGDGRDWSPFGSISGAVAAASAGDSILVLESGTTLEEAVTLSAGLTVIGAGTSQAVNRTLDDPSSTVVTLLAGGEVSPIVNSAGTTFTLSTNNELRGFTITNTAGAGAGIAGTVFGTLTVNDLYVNTTGAALDLTAGALSGTFAEVTSTGSTGSGITLTNVTGTPTILGGSLSGSGGATFTVSGGSVSFTYPGNLTRGTAGSLVSILGGHSGGLTFGGTLQATAGDGLQFFNADGSYTFTGTTTLNGGDAGVDIVGGSDGVFTFAAATSITSPTGAAFRVNGSTPTVTYSGNITQATAAVPMVDVTDVAADSVRFLTGTLAATNGTGLQLNNADGIVRFLGTVTLNGGDAGVDVVNGSAGIAEFPALTVTNPTGTGIVVDGSPNGTITFGATTVNKGATSGGGVLLNNNTGATITFASLGVNTSNGQPLLVESSGTVNVTTGTGSLSSAQQNTGLGIGNTAVAMNFANITVVNPHMNTGSVALRGIVLANVTGTGITVSGNTSISGTGAQPNLEAILVQSSSAAFDFGTTTISGILGSGAGMAAVRLISNTGPVTFDALTTNSLASGVRGMWVSGSSGTVTVSDGFLRTTGEPALLAATSALAMTLDSIGVQSPGANSGVSLTTVTGSVTANGGVINGGTATPVLVSGGSVDLTFGGSITQASNAPLLTVNGGHTGTLNFVTGTLSATNGTGLQFDNADGTYDFDGPVSFTNSVGGADAGIDISNNSDGVFTFAGNAVITNPANQLITIQNSVSPFSFTYSGGLTKNNNAVTALLIQNNSGGTITFDGDATTADGDPADVARAFSTTTATAVNLSSNSGVAINFNGGGLAITTTGGAGFSATGGGTVQVTGAGNTVNATGGGTAVNIQNTTIGGSGVSFYSVNATGSGTNGIVLSNTGAGGFQVTGDGASDEGNTTRGRTTARAGGGSITLGSGGSISGRSGHGVSLTTTGAVTLRNMVITGSGSSGDGINASSTGRLTVDNMRVTGHASDHGILGSTVGGLAIHHSEIDNNGTTVGVVEGPDIWNIRMLQLSGTDTVRNSNIHHSQENVLGIINTSGTLNLTVLNSDITDTGAGAGGTTALMVAANGSSNVTLNVQSSSILRGRSRGIQIGTEAGSSAVLNTTINNTTFTNNGGAIDLSHGSGGTNTFNITNNNIQATTGSLQAIIVNRAGSPSFNSFGLFQGTVSGNIVGTAGTPNSGADLANGIEVESNGSGGIMRVAVVNNTVREVRDHGIYVAVVDANVGGTAPPLLEARVAGNSVANIEPAPTGLDGIHILPGALNTDDVTMCLDIANNNSTGSRNGLRVRPGGLPTAPATVQLEGWDGSTARQTYFTSRGNTLASTGGFPVYVESTPSAPGGFVAVANCNTP